MSGHEKNREPQRPESEAVEEALLLRAWSDGIGEEPDDAELPEELLALAEGTLPPEAAADARRRLARDPGLARAFGRFMASLRDPSLGSLDREAPGRLVAEATDLVLPAATSRARPGFLGGLSRWLAQPGWSWALASAAAVLFVTFVARDRAPVPVAEPPLRATDTVDAIAWTSPALGARIAGDIELAWTPLTDVVRYRIVFVDLADGEIVDGGRTETAQCIVPGATLAERLEGAEPHELECVIRARRFDGTEVTSEPRRIVWSAR